MDPRVVVRVEASVETRVGVSQTYFKFPWDLKRAFVWRLHNHETRKPKKFLCY